MAVIEVDLEAYALPDDHTVWKVSAGKTHRFYRAVRDAQTIFPDVRDLDHLNGNPRTWTDQQILHAIAEDRWSRELTKIAKRGEPQGSPTIGKRDRTVLTFLRRLWFEAKKGDLVIVPAEGWRESVLIGELLTEAGDIRRVEAKDGEYSGIYFGRPVFWRKSLPKQGLGTDLIKAIHTRTAVFPIKESLKEEIYRFAYASYVYREHYVAEFRTRKERFTAEDSVAVAVWLNGFDVLRNSLVHGDARAKESFAELGLDRLPDDLAAEVKINIQSPGEIFVRTVGPFALSLMTLFALAGCKPEEVDKNTVTVSLRQVGAGHNGVEKDVESDVNALKAALGEKRLIEANKYGKRAKEGAEISTGATLKTRSGKGK